MVARHDYRSDARPDPGWPLPQGTPVHPPMSVSMTAHDVLRVLDVLHLTGVTALVAGGWGVDALVGRQTRAHRDLDLLVDRQDKAAAFETLDGVGYSTIEIDNEHRATVRQRDGRVIDLTFVDRQAAAPHLPAAALDGRGFIVGRPVRCVSANGQVLLHASDDLPDEQQRDLWLLSDRCGVSLAAPLGRSTQVSYRRAEPGDLGAMAVMHQRALRHTFGTDPNPAVRVLGEAGPSASWRYWEKRLQVAGTWTGVMMVGGAVSATAAVAAPESAGGSASLYALHLDPSLPDRHLVDPLLQRALNAAHEFGTDDVRVWINRSHLVDVRFFERRGWRPDGSRHTVDGVMSLVRYARH